MYDTMIRNIFFQKMKQFFYHSPSLLVLQTPVSGLTYDLPTNTNNLQACLKFHKNKELYTSYPLLQTPPNHTVV